MHPRTISWEGDLPGHVVLLEQTLLPAQDSEISIDTVTDLIAAIFRLAVRGAPAIGCAGAYGVVLSAQTALGETAEDLLAQVEADAERLRTVRPTAINLAWALERMLGVARASQAAGHEAPAIAESLLAEARDIQREDADQCEKMGAIGAALLSDGARILTHCNAGALATGGMGTALAPIYTAHDAGVKLKVFAGETRPLLQGARLTAWELARHGVDVTLITDSMAGHIMYEGRVDLVIVGADRIALNGDVCNKIGTYSLAVLARQHERPFYVVAPLSTFDPKCPDGASIPIEQRPAEEVTQGFGDRTAPQDVAVYNPAFDVTPARLVTGIVTEVGMIEAPTREKVEQVLQSHGRA